MIEQKIKYIGRCCVLVAVLTFLYIGTVNGEANPKGYMDEKAVAVMKNMSKYLSKAQSLGFEVTTLYDHILKSGIKIKYSKKSEIFVKRPNKFLALILSDDRKRRRISFDGNILTRLMVNENTYQELNYSGDTDKVIDYLIDNYNVDLPLADFLYNDIAGTFRKHIISAEYMGERMVDGVPCHHLSFESTGADWQLWVQTGNYPIPLRFSIQYIHVKELPEFIAIFKNWRVNLTLKEDIFNFVTPVGAKQVELNKTPNSTQVQ